MALAASHAAMAALFQAMTEISLGILLIIGAADPDPLLCRVPVSRQPLGLGVGHLDGFGNCGSAPSHRSGSLSDAQAGDGAWRRCWRTASSIGPLAAMSDLRASVRHYPDS